MLFPVSNSLLFPSGVQLGEMKHICTSVCRSGTQSVNTPPVCAGNQAVVLGQYLKNLKDITTLKFQMRCFKPHFMYVTPFLTQICYFLAMVVKHFAPILNAILHDKF